MDKQIASTDSIFVRGYQSPYSLMIVSAEPGNINTNISVFLRVPFGYRHLRCCCCCCCLTVWPQVAFVVVLDSNGHGE